MCMELITPFLLLPCRLLFCRLLVLLSPSLLSSPPPCPLLPSSLSSPLFFPLPPSSLSSPASLLSSPPSTLSPFLSPPPTPLLSSPLSPSPPLSRYWVPGQPDNWGKEPGQDCGQVLGASQGLWTDERCDAALKYICKVTNRESHIQDTGSLVYSSVFCADIEVFLF